MAHGGVRHPDLASSSFRIRRKMTFIALPGLVRALCFLAAAAAELVFCTEADSAQQRCPRRSSRRLPRSKRRSTRSKKRPLRVFRHSYQEARGRLPALGKMLFFDQSSPSIATRRARSAICRRRATREPSKVSIWVK